MELLFQWTDFHPLFSLKGIKYSLKAEYSCTVTSDLSHIPLGFKGNCQRSTKGRREETRPGKVWRNVYSAFITVLGLGFIGLIGSLELLLPSIVAILLAVAKLLTIFI